MTSRNFRQFAGIASGALALLVGMGASAADADGQSKNYNDLVVAESFKQPVAVLFWARWCGLCVKTKSAFDQVMPTLTGKVMPVALSVDESVPGQPNLTSIPMVFIYTNGKIDKQLLGLQSNLDLQCAMEPYSGTYHIHIEADNTEIRTCR